MKTFQEWTSRERCTLCGATSGLQKHHKVYRSRMGSDDSRNLALLCVVCHGAVHGLSAVLDGHSCQTCRVLTSFGCHWGEKITGKPVVTPPDWDDRVENR